MHVCAIGNRLRRGLLLFFSAPVVPGSILALSSPIGAGSSLIAVLRNARPLLKKLLAERELAIDVLKEINQLVWCHRTQRLWRRAGLQLPRRRRWRRVASGRPRPSIASNPMRTDCARRGAELPSPRGTRSSAARA